MTGLFLLGQFISIKILNGNFKWNDEIILNNINLEIKNGSLVAICGSVGCGKSSLLNSILGETEKISGDVFINGSIAYVSQLSWIQNSILRDNILFGKEYNEEFYKKIIKSKKLP